MTKTYSLIFTEQEVLELTIFLEKFLEADNLMSNIDLNVISAIKKLIKRRNKILKPLKIALVDSTPSIVEVSNE